MCTVSSQHDVIARLDVINSELWLVDFQKMVVKKRQWSRIHEYTLTTFGRTFLDEGIILYFLSFRTVWSTSQFLLSFQTAPDRQPHHKIHVTWPVWLCVWERDFGRVKNDDSGVLEPKRVRFDSFLHYCVYLFESMRLTVMIYRFWCQLLLKYLFLPSVHCNNLKWDYRHPVTAITVSLYSTIIVSFSCRSLKKFGSLNDCVCHACVRDHTNVLGIVPMLAYVLHK